VITYIIIAGTFYLAMDYVIRKDVEERLKVEMNDFEHYIQSNAKWKEGNYFVENKIELKKIAIEIPFNYSFKDTVLRNKYSGELVPFREINFYTRIGSESYKVSIRKSLIESDDLLYFITVTMLGLLLLGLLLLYIFQRKISKQIWMPFYHTLSEAKQFDLKTDKKLKTESGGIYEFEELNDVLLKMTQKMRKDYQNLKEFTENASHEIQTPLALINARVEQLIQDKNLSEEQMYWIQEIHNSSMRLSKLNYALLLLSKIENEQFPETERVDFNELIKIKFLEFEDILSHKNIEMKIVQAGSFSMLMNKDLADILISNLVGNSIKHNLFNGKIDVSINNNEILVENTGLTLKSKTEKLFQRFKKEQTNSSSLGLGLAIVKKICDYYKLNIQYKFEAGIHSIKINKS
jgi:signal transduction histidine kinase